MTIYTLVVLNTPPQNLTFIEITTPQALHVLILAPNYDEAFQIVQTFKPDYFLFEETFPMITGIQLSTLLHLQSGLELIPTMIFQHAYQRNLAKKSTQVVDQITLAAPQWRSMLEIIEMMLSFSRKHLLYTFIGPEVYSIEKP